VTRWSGAACFFLAFTAARPAAGQRSASTLIDRAQIEAAGWNRLSELLEGATRWSRSSVDGFTFAASPDRLPATGISAPGMTDWIVFVDRQRVPANLFGDQLLELLPISTAQIESVTVTRGPLIVRGLPTSRGIIEIFLRRAPPGAHGAATYQHGDETGDPGPFRYTTLTSPNVEKIGPFAHASASYARERWAVDVGVHLASVNVSDVNITSRFSPGIFGQLEQQVSAVTPTARVEARALGGEHRFFASRGEQRGLLFVPGLGAEQSLRTTASYAGIAGSIAARGSTVSYELSRATTDVAELASPLPFLVGHLRRENSGEGAWSRSWKTMSLAIGAGATNWRLDHAGAENQSRTVSRLFMRARSIDWPAVRAGASVSVSRAVSGTALDAAFDFSYEVTRQVSLEAATAVVHAIPELDGTWIDRVVLTGSSVVPAVPVIASADIGAAWRIADDTRATFGVRGARAAHWSLVAGAVNGEAPQRPVPIDSIVRDGGTLGAYAGLRSGWGPLRGMLELERAAIVSGDATMRGAMGSTAGFLMRASIQETPTPDLRLNVAALLMPRTQWVGFVSAPNDTTSIVPSVRRIDFSAEKWLWQRRLKAQLLFRNLLDLDERYHPYGAQWNLRTHLSVTLAIP
jgi:hypothetical protein